MEYDRALSCEVNNEMEVNDIANSFSVKLISMTGNFKNVCHKPPFQIAYLMKQMSQFFVLMTRI